MRERRIIGMLVAVLCAGSAVAEPKVFETQPIAGDPFRDIRIEECEGTRGFGIFTYETTDSVFRLSDLCVMEEAGDVISAETLRGLELTKKNSEGRAFENLKSGKSDYQRNSLAFTPDENAPDCTPEPVESIRYFIPNPEFIRQFPNATSMLAQGYTTKTVNSKPAHRSMQVYLGIRNISQGELGSNTMTTPVVNGFGDMYAVAEFSESSGNVTISKGYGHNYGDAGGNLEIQLVGNGEFQAKGKFAAKSARIVGHEPHEMVTISGDIPYMRGHILGSNGAEMLGYGLVVGTYDDASGQTHSYRAIAHFISCAGNAK